MIVCGASEAAQQLLLELPGVNTCTQKMLNRLIFLAREGATLRMRKATTCEPVCCLAAIVCNQPEKKNCTCWEPKYSKSACLVQNELLHRREPQKLI